VFIRLPTHAWSLTLPGVALHESFSRVRLVTLGSLPTARGSVVDRPWSLLLGDRDEEARGRAVSSVLELVGSLWFYH
jgi:hypothetical protein